MDLCFCMLRLSLFKLHLNVETSSTRKLIDACRTQLNIEDEAFGGSSIILDISVGSEYASETSFNSAYVLIKSIFTKLSL